MRPSSPPARPLVAALLVSALPLGGCARVPDPIPYEAIVGERKPEAGHYRITELAGATLKLDGKPVGVLQEESTKVSLHARWTAPKATRAATMNGTYTLSIPGPCGAYEIPAEGPPPNWRNMDESTTASSIKSFKALSVYLDVDVPTPKVVVIDRGAVTGEVRIGAVTVPAGAKRLDLPVGGCTEDLPITVAGKPFGALPSGEGPALVTLEPGICHVAATAAYGDGAPASPPQRYPAEPVVALTTLPSYLLESPPASVKVYGSAKGTTTTYLVRTPCP